MASKVRTQSYMANPPLTTCSNMLKKSLNVRTVISTHLLTFKNSSIHWNSISDSKPLFTIRAAAEPNSDVISEAEVAAAELKSDLYKAVQGINRGIFGITSEKKIEIERLITLLESKNPTAAPTDDIHKLVGSWKLLFSTITILGSKRTKLGLRNFISLGDFYQTIDVTQGKAINMIKFSVKGLSLLNGQLEIVASYKISSASRVSISYENSAITPDQLMSVFNQKLHTLLEIFNPEGWLEITYVDNELRIGRDNKGNIFVMERVLQDL